jgi:hypothetical protein
VERLDQRARAFLVAASTRSITARTNSGLSRSSSSCGRARRVPRETSVGRVALRLGRVRSRSHGPPSVCARVSVGPVSKRAGTRVAMASR